MSTIIQTRTRAIVAEAQLRRRLLTAAIWVTALGFIDHVDHVVRGNHIGWPFGPAVTPSTFSLLVYPFLLNGMQAGVGRLGTNVVDAARLRWHARGYGPATGWPVPCRSLRWSYSFTSSRTRTTRLHVMAPNVIRSEINTILPVVALAPAFPILRSLLLLRARQVSHVTGGEEEQR